MTFRTAYDGIHPEVGIDFSEVQGMTEQCHKDSCDVNTILKQFDKTGLITHVNEATAKYGDYTAVNEFQESMNLILQAQADFDELPSKIRRQFNNDPGEFFEFVTNPENYDECVSLGIIEKVEDATTTTTTTTDLAADPPVDTST